MTTDKPMELNEAISRLLRAGVLKVTFGLREDKQLQVNAEQFLNDGQQHFVHHAIGATAEECWRGVLKSVEHCNELQATIMRLPRNGR